MTALALYHTNDSINILNATIVWQKYAIVLKKSIKRPMQVRWNYKLQPNKGQSALMDEWLVTLRKHRNCCLAERKRGFETNNQDADEPVMYQWGSYCELDTRFIAGAYSPLTCPVVKHGVMSAELTKRGGTAWGSVSDIQSKRTTELRHESEWYSRIDSDVLQSNQPKPI